jgi:type IV pilus assembly protein PilQ
VKGAETKMTLFKKARVAHRLIAGCVIAAAVGGGLVKAAPAANIRLVGVSAQGSGRTGAVLIESTEPVAYAVSRPDPLTVLVDLRNVSVADAATDISRNGPVAGVKVEQATGIDGKELARVRVTLASPSSYKVRSSRNVIRLELERDAAPSGLPAAPRTPAVADNTAIAAATSLDKVRTSHTRTSTIVTLAGNGRLMPSALTESDDQPRRLVLDFPNVSTTAAPRTGVDGVFVKQVRVAVNSREPLVTRVVMEISSTATYHVERTGPGGRDLALVFEGPTAGGQIMVAPPSAAAPQAEPDDIITMTQALANAASITPADPITALNIPASGEASASARATADRPVGKPSSVVAAPIAAPRVAPPTSAARQTQPPTLPVPPEPQQPPVAPPAQQPPPAPPAQNPPTAPAPQQPFSSAVPGSGQKVYVGHPINFDFEDADLRAVLRIFSAESGLNMIIDPQVSGRVNVLLNDVPWDQALDQILRSNKLGYTVEGNIIRIAPLSVLSSEQKEQAEYQAQQALAGELRVQTFSLSYARGDAVSPILTKSVLSPRGQIQVDPRTNMLIIQDLPDRLATAASLIGTLDRPQPQVEVEARVVQTSRDFARAIGIQWGFNGRANSAIGNTTGLAFPNSGAIGGRVSGNQTANDPRGGNEPASTAINLPTTQAASSAIGLALGSINGAFNLDIALTALENTGKGRILSSPRLTTQNNQQAVVRQGVQIPVQTVANNTVSTTFVNADLSLTVTPQITMANTVIMNIGLVNASPDFSRAVNGTPPINSQSATTTVQVNDGATTVIGGIFVSEEQTNNDRTPVLHRVPILKWLFQRNSLTDSSRELLIFITPRILRG